jgi:biotin carboxyl carrier protein
VLEAMKMEHAIQATFDGRVKRVHCEQGERVAGGMVLFELEPAVSK